MPHSGRIKKIIVEGLNFLEINVFFFFFFEKMMERLDGEKLEKAKKSFEEFKKKTKKKQSEQNFQPQTKKKLLNLKKI